VLVQSATPAQAALQPCAVGYVRLTFDARALPSLSLPPVFAEIRDL
jgi:hypothetical protein